MNKLTINEAKKRFKEKHGDKYRYFNFCRYEGTSQKIKIICPIHGEFFQSVKMHLAGQGCRLCSYEKRASQSKKTSLVFITESKEVHGDEYDYSKVFYLRKDKKVKIICPIHGVFLQRPDVHLNGAGCPTCGRIKSDLSRRKTTEDFINRSVKVHGNKYNYAKTKYVTAKEKVLICCKKHGEFLQRPNNHLNGAGCPVCCESRERRK